MGVNLSGTVPADPSSPTSWIDELLSGAGGLGQGILESLTGLLDTIGEILRTGVAIGGALLDGIVQGVRGLIGAIDQAVRGLLPSGHPFAPLQDTFHDGQHGLVTRLDLIPQGYCSAYMSRNVSLNLGGNNLRKMPFGSYLGPNQGAHIDPDSGHIVFDEVGTWTVHTLLHGRGTAFTGDNNVNMYVSVRRPDHSIFSEKYVMASPNTNPVSLTLSQPFVIPEPGYYVAVWAWSGRWRTWNGGTTYSGLTVIKAHQEYNRPGQGEVEDEEGTEP